MQSCGLCICRERHRGPLVIVAEAPGGSARLTQAMPLLAEFPMCEVPPHSADSAYPSLSWQPKATRRAVMRLAAAAPWLEVREPISNTTLINKCPFLYLTCCCTVFARSNCAGCRKA